MSRVNVPSCLVFLTLLGLPLAQAQNAPSPVEQSTWKQFRSQYPFHIQTVAASSNGPQGSIILISEPPPHFNTDKVEQLMPALHDPVVMQHSIGVDGWVKDVLYQIPPMSIKDRQELLNTLNAYLFYTDYKAPVLTLPARRKMLVLPTDLQVSTYALSKWAGSRREVFLPLFGNGEFAIPDFLTGDREGVYLSKTPGLVLWVLPRDRDVSLQKKLIREFALDSDLILGAVSGDSTVIVVGRERVAPLEMLPPLRVETIISLASTQKDELAQSYERTNFAAGKFDSVHNLDWAPIYLSPELIDTEYGSLLNITDQLLKSWSEDGRVKYQGFSYPAPSQWPDFPGPLSRALKVEQVTYNWNTKGVGYTDATQSMILYGLYRTGALPVSYIPGGDKASTTSIKKALELELTGYDYFARLKNPDLARVVQYAALYQIFRSTKVHSSLPAGSNSSEDQRDVHFRSQIETCIANFGTWNQDELKANLDRFTDRNLAPVELISALEDIDHLEGLQEKVKLINARAGPSGISQLAERLAQPERFLSADQTLARRMALKLRAEDVKTAESEVPLLESPDHIFDVWSGKVGDRFLNALGPEAVEQLAMRSLAGELQEHASLIRFVTGTSISSLKKAFEDDHPKDSTVGWIHTPTLVISEGLGDEAAFWTGGHNLDAATTEFREVDSVLPHHVKIIEDHDRTVVEYNSADKASLPEITQVLGRFGNYVSTDRLSEVLSESLLEATAPPPQSRYDILQMTPAHRPSVDRGLQNGLDSPYKTIGFTTKSATLTSAEGKVLTPRDDDRAHIIFVDRTAGSPILVRYRAEGTALEAGDLSAALRAVTEIAQKDAQGGMSTHICFRTGFEENEAEGFLTSVKVKTADNEAVDLTGSVATRELSPEEIGNLLASGDYDFPNAEVSEAKLVSSDAEVDTYSVDVTVKATEKQKPPLLMRFLISIKRGLANAGQVLSQMVSDIRVSLAERISARDEQRVVAQVRRIRKDIEKKYAATVTISIQAKDVNVSWSQPPSIFGVPADMAR